MKHSPEVTERLAKAMTVTAWSFLPVCLLIAAGGAVEVYPSVMLITEALGNDGGDVSLAAIASVAFVGTLLGIGITANLMLRGFAQLLLAVHPVEDDTST